MKQTTYQKAKQLTIYPANCLNERSPLAQCNICQQLCPQQGLSWQEDHWQVTDCSLCGLCAMACPTQVFQIDLPQLLQQPKGPLQLCCHQNPSPPPSTLRLNCLQQLSPLTLCYLLYQHQQITLYLTPKLCQSCPQQWYPQGLLQQLAPYHIPAEQLNLVLQEPAAQPEPSGSPQPENQRRELLRNFWHRTEEQSKKAAVQAAEAITATGSAHSVQVAEPEIFPQRLPLYALYVKKQLPIHPEGPLPFRQLRCQACSFCGACSHLCPTKALTLTEQDGEKQLQYQPELCINCNLCQAICMQQGLQWDDFMSQRQFLQTPQPLAHSAEKICSNCQHSFYQWPPTEDQLCAFCQHTG